MYQILCLYIYTYIYIYMYLLTHLYGQDVTKDQFLSSTSLKSDICFSMMGCLTKAKEPSLPYYLHIVGGRIVGFTSFPRILVLCEMLSASSRI